MSRNTAHGKGLFNSEAGAGLRATGSYDLSIQDSTFAENDADSCGGLFLSSKAPALGTAHLDGTTFISNPTIALCALGSTSLTIVDSEFAGNEGFFYETGAIFIGVIAPASVSIDGTTFSDNYRSALSIIEGSVRIENSAVLNHSRFGAFMEPEGRPAELISIDTDWGTPNVDDNDTDIKILGNVERTHSYTGTRSFKCDYTGCTFKW